jgi:hypothetical protein
MEEKRKINHILVHSTAISDDHEWLRSFLESRKIEAKDAAVSMAKSLLENDTDSGIEKKISENILANVLYKIIQSDVKQNNGNLSKR